MRYRKRVSKVKVKKGLERRKKEIKSFGTCDSCDFLVSCSSFFSLCTRNRKKTIIERKRTAPVILFPAFTRLLLLLLLLLDIHRLDAFSGTSQRESYGVGGEGKKERRVDMLCTGLEKMWKNPERS